MTDNPPSIPALVAGVSSVLMEVARQPLCPPWIRACLSGPAETGIAAAMILESENDTPSSRDKLRQLAQVADDILPKMEGANAARAAVRALRTLLHYRGDSGHRVRLEQILRTHTNAWKVVIEVDRAD